MVSPYRFSSSMAPMYQAWLYLERLQKMVHASLKNSTLAKTDARLHKTSRVHGG